MATIHSDRSQPGGDPNWPIGYPAEALLSYQPAPNTSGGLPPNVMAVTTSQKLKITSKIQNRVINGNVCSFAHAVSSAPNARSGVVPITIGHRRIVTIGTRARLDEPLFIDIPSDTAPRLNWNDIGTYSTRLPRTVWTLINKLYDHRQSIGTYNPRMDRLRTPNDRRQVFVEFMEAYASVNTRAGNSMAQILNADFSIRSLLEVSFHIVPGDDSHPVTIYLLAHYNLYLIEIYIGKSIRPGMRLRTHISAKGNPNSRSSHYRTAHKAGTTTMIPLMQLKRDTKWLFLAEQINLCLFHAYCPAVLNFGIANGAFATSNETLHKYAEYSNDSRAARQITAISDAVFTNTGWPLSIQRGDPRNDRVLIKAGCNWKSPFTEPSHEKVRYSVSTLVGLGKVFRRPPLTFPMSGNIHFGYDNDLAIGRMQLDLIPAGTQYYICFELTANGEPHPQAYARLPLYFGMNNRDEAMSWALRLEWKEGTQWFQCYVYHRHPGRLAEFTPCAFNSYKIGIRTYHWLRQEILQIPAYMRFLGQPGTGIRLTTVDLDHASRTVTVRDAGRAVQLPTQDGPRYSTVQENIDLISTVSDENTAIGARTNNLTRCDGCRIINCTCEHDPDTHQLSCKNCLLYNRLCTWTPDQHLAGSDLEKAYLSPDLTSQKRPIADPGHESVDLDEVHADIDDEDLFNGTADEARG